MKARSLLGSCLALTAASAGFVTLLSGCPKDDSATKEGTPPPPPSTPSASPSGAVADPCAAGKGVDSDAISAPFFPQSITTTTPAQPLFCIDPATDVKTYGDHGKLSMDDVCTTAFDGECEVYKRFGLKRTVALRYVDNKGKGSTIDVILSQFATVDGAYGMYTKRVIADSDPTDPTAPRAIAGINAKASGAIGTGRAYVWKNDQIVELQYNNENETPEQLAASSDSALTALAKSMADKLPAGDLPAAAAVLPVTNRVPNGVQFYTKDVMGIVGGGEGAVGFYKDATKRWRDFAVVGATENAAKDAFKAIKSKPGSLPVTPAADGITADEAAHVIIEQAKDKPKTEWLVVRRGAEIDAVGDEEYAVAPNGTAAGASPSGRLSKDDAIALLKGWTAQPAHAATGVNAAGTGASGAPASDGGAPSSASSAPRR